MAITTPTSSAETPAVETAVARIREEKLTTANVVGDYVKGLEDASRGAEQQEVAEELTDLTGKERAAVADVLKKDAKAAAEASKDSQDLKIDHSLTGSDVQGNALVGGGRGTINVNRDAVARISEGDDARNAFINLTAHELAHAEEQKPMGDVVTAKGTVRAWALHEAHSERKGAEAQGEDVASFSRDGQPDDYAEAQKQGNELRALGVSDADFDDAIGEGGQAGTVRLQTLIIKGEMERGTLTPEAMAKNLQSDRGIYREAAMQVFANAA